MTNPSRELPPRVVAVDAYRGLVMFLMMAEVLRLSTVAANFPTSRLWQTLAFHTTHVAWAGCSLHDLIQPGFSFLVGVALPFSIANRQGRGQSTRRMFGHAVWRALLLVGLGVFLSSVGQPRTNFTFADTLCQIGLGYVLLFLLGLCPPLLQWLGLAAVLIGYWGAFALYPLPGSDFAYQAVAVPADWPHHYQGFAAHWNKNSNLAWAFDQWFLNLFPRDRPFVANAGGYATLSFIPTLGTMILGLLAGGWLQQGWSGLRKVGQLALAGVICLALGLMLDQLGLCPVVKRIWTPAWTLYSGGWCLLFLAGFYLLCDVASLGLWFFPLMVIGMNSIFIYCSVRLMRSFVQTSLRTHLGAGAFKVCGDAYEPLLAGAATLLVFWLMLFWLYRQRVFIRI